MTDSRTPLVIVALVLAPWACAPATRTDPAHEPAPDTGAKVDPALPTPSPKPPVGPDPKTVVEPPKPDLPAVFPLIHWATTKPVASDGAVAEILRGEGTQSDGLRIRRDTGSTGSVAVAGPSAELPAGSLIRIDAASNLDKPADFTIELIGPASTVKALCRAAPAQTSEPTVVMIPWTGKLTSLTVRPSGDGAWDASLIRADVYVTPDAKFDPMPRDTQLVVDVRVPTALAFTSAEVFVLREGATPGSTARLVRRTLEPGARVAIFGPADLAAPPLVVKPAAVCVLVRSTDGVRAVGRSAMPTAGRALVRKFTPTDFAP